MKATLAALTCLALVSCAVAVRRKNLRSQPGGNLSDVSDVSEVSDDSAAPTVAAAVESADESSVQSVDSSAPSACGEGRENYFPLDPTMRYSASGLVKWQAMFPLEALRQGLASKQAQNWLIGSKWNLTVTADNYRTTPARFGFAGNRSKGFLELTVPGGAAAQRISVADFVLTAPERSRFEYLDDEPITGHDVVLTNICLSPVLCDSWTGSCPAGFVRKANTSFGQDEDSCCTQPMCSDDDYCTPATQWEKAMDYDSRHGGSALACCKPKMCTEAACETDGKEWRLKSGTGWQGETKEECCEPQMCMEFDCDNSTRWKKPYPITGEYHLRQGGTHERCCEPKKCDTFVCEHSKVWKDKPGKSKEIGSTFPECCDPAYCHEYDVCDGTTSKDLPTVTENGTLRRGHEEETCCEKLWCKDHVCTHESLELNLAGLDRRRGSTDDVCCKPKICSDWTCSSQTKLVHRARIEKGVEVEGWNDDTCCTPILCKSHHCSPVTQYKLLENESLDGSTNEECCEPIYCETYTCTGDINGTGESTQWYKRVDTNLKLKGSTDEECCLPKYCSDYTTSHPTMYKRKSGDGLLGSTDAECYDAKYCQDYACKDPSKKLKPCDWGLKGSTDEECCTDKGEE